MAFNASLPFWKGAEAEELDVVDDGIETGRLEYAVDG